MKNENYIIRKAQKTDVDDLIYLLKILFSIEKDFEYNPLKHKLGLELLLSNTDSACIMVCEFDKRIIGMVSGQLVASTAEGGYSIWLEDLVVDEKFRCLKIGETLLESIYQWGKLKGCKRVQLLADKENSLALNFYKKQKWSETQMICLRKKLNPTNM